MFRKILLAASLAAGVMLAADARPEMPQVRGLNGRKAFFVDGKPFLIRRVPRVLLDKIKALDFASIKQAVGPYLTDKEIESIIARKKLILDEIAEMVKQNGEDKVLY